MRWVQLTLVENDPGRFDPQFWLDYFRRLHADAATLSAGGIVAYYPTEVPLHHRSALARRRAIRSARWSRAAATLRCTSSRAPIRTRCATRCGRRIPTGSRVNRKGEPVRHWANPELWVTCALGPYNFEFMDQVHREIVTRYQVDGIFANRWAPQGGDCYCVHCQQNFKAATGLDAAAHERPARRGAAAVPRVAHRAADRAVEALGRDGAGRRTPTARFIPNGPPSMKSAGELAAIQFTDNQARRGLTPPWNNGRRAKEYRSVMGRRPIGGIFSVGVEEPYRWKDSVQSEPEIRAVGGRGHRERHAALGHEVLRRALRPPLAAGGRAHLRLALPPRTLPAERGAARPDRAALLGTDGALSPWRGDRRPCGGSRARHVSRADRSAAALRAGARGVPHRRSARPVQGADPRRCGRAVRRAVRGDPRATSSAAAAWSPRSPARCTTNGASRGRTSASPTSSASRSTAASKGRCRTRI